MTDHSRYAWPGDDDLDCDLHDVIVTSVIADDNRGIIVGLRGGSGRFESSETGEMTEIDTVEEMTLAAWFPHMTNASWDNVNAMLNFWRDHTSPLRVCAAPDRMTSLIQHEDDFGWLVFPRRAFPDIKTRTD